MWLDFLRHMLGTKHRNLNISDDINVSKYSLIENVFRHLTSKLESVNYVYPDEHELRHFPYCSL